MTVANPDIGVTPTATVKQQEAVEPRTRIDKTYYFMLVPVVLLFTVFITIPALVGAFYSFTDYSGYGSWTFTGLTNYISIFSDSRILHAYGFTLFLAVVTVIVVNISALGIALGLSSKIKLRNGLRVVYFVPLVLSGIVVAYVFNYFFSTSLPTIATSLGISSLETSLLANSNWAWVTIVIVTAWQAIPGAMIIYLAGLLAIPSDVYEAASMDGATPRRSFRHITLPLVAGYVVVNTILGVKSFLNAYDVVVGLTNGGPGTSTMTIAMTIFTGFTSGDYAYQMANAVIFFIVTVFISLFQLQLIRRRGVSF